MNDSNDCGDTRVKQLIEEANQVFQKHFGKETCFERAVFYSWACKLEVCCKYCYMSALPPEKRTQERVRSFESMIAETLIIKRAGWDYGFLSGGIGVLSEDRIMELLKLTVEIMQEKIWVNIGVMDKKTMTEIKPFVKGVVGTVEVINPELHDRICPSKPIAAVEQMFEDAKNLGLKRAMTLIVGLGETIEDLSLLETFIQKHNVSKIHVYGLNPQKGTEFEHHEGPTAEYQAEWIARLRIRFPELDIQCGIWTDRVDRVGLLLRAGANSISKYPALKKFGCIESVRIEKEAEDAGREFRGTLTDVACFKGIEQDVEKLPVSPEMKLKIKQKLEGYMEKIKKHQNNR